ncbi:unnamed protein product [Pleuronectes platessa]|uniref:Uncharacterized protein n=1 Tax=Pleuronectes platessa TaxID=8262 RepID=A0A9N7UCG7_PLEPL|nr:unnamed protein product [Pleuronectes platessa]
MRVDIPKDNPNMTCQVVPLQAQSMLSNHPDHDPPSRPDATPVLSHRPPPPTRTHHKPPPRSWSTARAQCQRDTGSATSTTISPHDSESATMDPPPRPPVHDPQTAIHGAATEALDLRLFQRTQLQTARTYIVTDTPFIRPVSQNPTSVYATNMPDRKHRAPRPCPPRQAEQCDIPQVRDRDPNQGRRDNPEVTMAEGQESRDSTPPYRHRQPFVRPTQQYYEHRTYEPRPGPEGRHPHIPERPVYSGAKSLVRDLDPNQRGRDVTEETMAEGRGSMECVASWRSPLLSPHLTTVSPSTLNLQYRHRQPYVRPTPQYHDHRTYEPRPGPEGRHPLLPERPVYSGAKRMVRDRDPNQRGRDVTEETMAEGRGRWNASPPGGHRSSPPTQPQYRHRQPYVRPTQQYYDHRTNEPRPGPEGRHPLLPERPVYSGAKRMVRDRDPNQRGRDVTEETMAEGRGRWNASPPGGHRSSPPTSQQYRHRQPYVRPTPQYHDHRTNEPRPGPEGRHPLLPERPVYSGAKRMVRDRDPNQRGRDVTEETMAEGRGRWNALPPGGHRSSPPTSQQYRHRQPYVRPSQQYHDHRTYEPRPGPEGRHPLLPERPVYSGAKRMVRDRDPNQRGRDVTEETMAEGRGRGMRRLLEHSKRPGKQTGKAVDPTTQPIVMNKKGASDTKPGPDDAPKLQPVGQRSPSPGLVQPEAPVETPEAQPTPPANRESSAEEQKPSLSPPNPPIPDRPLLDAPSTLATTLPEGSWSPWELRQQMVRILLEDMASDKEIFHCVKEKLERTQMSSSPYLRELMTAVCQAAVKAGTACKTRVRYSEKEQQRKALQELQELIVTLDRPPNLLRIFFQCKCDEDASSEALKSVTAFFIWLREADSQDN